MTESSFEAFFQRVTGHTPYDYQTRCAELLLNGANVLLRAPTGAGKTYATLVPFLYRHLRGEGPRRLIYALPLRTLVESIGREARDLVAKAHVAVDVTTQTGEQPDDPFFTLGEIVITTYDQVLSGLLCSPYGLPRRLANVNAACLTGCLVVFDEFHLMEPGRAFLTSAAMLGLHGSVVQSVWMTATATSALGDLLATELGVHEVGLEATDLTLLPSVARVERRLASELEPLTAEHVLAHSGDRVIAIVNSVDRAQALFEAIDGDRRAPERRMLLHSRFFRTDRKTKEAVLRDWFGRGARAPALLVATQVIEAGVDITCDHLHTEVCPVNALVQRAGRCARFAPREGTAVGTVHVHPLPEGASSLPYDAAALTTTATLARDATPETRLDPALAMTWVEHAHATDDALGLRPGVAERRRDALRRIRSNVLDGLAAGVSDLIRGGDDSVRVVVNHNPPDDPGQLEGITVRRRGAIARLRDAIAAEAAGWAYAPGDEPEWRPIRAAEDLRDTYVICLRPDVASYDPKVGLRLGVPGVRTSPATSPPRRPGYSPLRVESWVAHTRAVAREAERRVAEEARPGSPLARTRAGIWAGLRKAARAAGLLHDVGKLQQAWQAWAEAAQRSRDPTWHHRQSLAHTDYDPSDPADRERERALLLKRPYHAPASAFVGAYCVAEMIVPSTEREVASSAVIAATLSHHGGWLPASLQVGALASDWHQAIVDATGVAPNRRAIEQGIAESPEEKAAALTRLLDVATGPDNIHRSWPFVAYLIRTLRLSDQRATAQGSCDG